MLLFLVGASGAGKTTHAGLLRHRLPGVAVLDLDEPFEEGAPPPELDRVWRA
jgi:adenylate kinase family enzyme